MPLISVVDDDLSVCRALRRLIQSAGYTVETFASAREFLDSSPEGRTACLVLDIHLGEVSGFELQEQLTARRAAIPIIFITAYDDASIRERITRSRVSAYLRKPFDERVLLDAIHAAIAQPPAAQPYGCGGGDGHPDAPTSAEVKRGPFPTT